MKSILDYFPAGWTPTPLQREVLLELQYRWNSSRVFVVKLDVASGKSAVAYTVAKWLEATDRKKSKGARICTPTNVLVDQYAKAFPDLAVTKSPGQYACETRGTTCGAYSAKQRCKGCVYTKARTQAQDSPVSVSTYHMTKALYSYRGTMIFDEAHNLGSVVRGLYSPSLFAHRVEAPREIVNDMELTAKWVLSLTTHDLSNFTEKERTILASFQKDLRSTAPLNFYNWSTDFWSNGGEAWGERLPKKGDSTELPTLQMQPLDIFSKPAPFWKDTQKLVLMSATVGRHDLYELGLDKERPVFIEGTPPITVDRNPIIKDYVGTISYSNQAKMLPLLAERLLHYLETKKGKGVVHITYGLAKLLKPLVDHPRLITHGQGNMKAKLREFLQSDNKVFLVSGMYEGVSLDYELADWQVITKIVWPSMQDPLQKHRAKEDPDYYLWTTLKTVVQTSGRVCRRPDDYGESYVWDASFDRLLEEGKHLVPRSFTSRISKGADNG